MQQSEWYPIIKEKYSDADTIAQIDRTFNKINEYFLSRDKILVSVSGGSDSDCIVHIVCTYFPEYLPKCNFVFVNTGLEFRATKRHLCELENKYGIEIERIRGKSVVWATRNYGLPILNKAKAKSLSLFLRRTPKGHYLVFEANGSYFGFTESERALARYLDENHIMVSSKCCDVSKKKPIEDYIKKHNITLDVTGERRSEGGIRAVAHKSCFEVHKGGLAKYMPLYWWDDDVKQNFKEAEGITYSDCYEVWGMKRTGCVGCPFGRDVAGELALMKKYEPDLFDACIKVFGVSYELTDKFNCRRKKCLPDSLNNNGTDVVNYLRSEE